MERATLGSGGDGEDRTGSNCGGCAKRSGSDGGNRNGSNCGGCELVLGSGGDGMRVCVIWLFLRAWATRKSVPRVLLCHTIHKDV